MSAAAASTMSDGKTASGDEPRLDQPKDAVLMKDMSPSPEMVIQYSSNAVAKDASKAAPAPELSSSNDHITVAADSADPMQPAQCQTSTAASKGKEKEVISAPPSKEDEPEEETSRENRRESIMAIGPAQDNIKSVTPGSAEVGLVCNITLLLASGGRHPYKLDAKYLTRRNVAMPDEDESGNPDPFSISIYTLKELILREWRDDWEAKPASPSSIRLIHFGKLLDDKEQLKKYQFSPESPNVVHMSIRPQDLDEEEPKAGGKSLPAGNGNGERVRGGRCCVIL